MKPYVDGFVIPVHKSKIGLYQSVAEKACALWKEHGALDYRECVGEDLNVEGQVPFPKLAGAGPEETVVFAWIMFESREHRDAVNAKVMADPRINEMCGGAEEVFDCTRMAYGGFTTIVQM